MAMSDDRGQAYTLEGVAAAGLVILGLLLAMQSIVLTPTTAGTVDQDVVSQLGTEANDILAAAHEEGAFSQAALFWNADEEKWVDEWNRGDCPEGEGGTDLTLCTMLEESFTDRFYQYNVYVDHRNSDRPEEMERTVLYESGTPGDNAAIASHSMALYENMNLTGQSDPPTLEEVESDPDLSFYADDLSGDEYLYNVVEIQVVVW